jgi:hypothetical protein
VSAVWRRHRQWFTDDVYVKGEAFVAKLRIPPEHRAAVAALTQLPAKSIEEIAAAIESGPPRLRAVREAVSRYITEEVDAVAAALTSLAYVVATTTDYTVEQVMADIRTGLGEEAGDADLTVLLGSPTLVALSKTVDLRTSYERILSDFRIITDIRPIFGAEVEEKIESAIVTHVARITYATADSVQECFVGLTHRDLLDMREKVERALTKEKRAHDFIEHRGGRVLESFKEEK